MLRFAIACIAALLFAGSAGEAPAQSDIRILRYDEDGRATGVERSGTGDTQSAADSAADPIGWEDPRDRYEPGEVLVVAPTPEVLRQARAQGFRVIERRRMAALGVNLFRLRVPPETSVRDALALLRRSFPDLVVDANHIFEPSATVQGAVQGAAPDSWVRAVIGWGPAARDCGRGLRLGVIDARVDLNHPALAEQRIEFRSFHRPERSPAPADHGTAVSAILIGRPSPEGWGGILPGAEVKAGNMFEFNEAGRLVGNAMALVKALDWMAEERVHVVNMSVAGADNKALRHALRRAEERGLVMVAAAGNWGRADRPAYPAAYDAVIAVTAFGAGGEVYAMANRGAYIDFAAPGVGLWTAVPDGGRYQSGTSFAVPYVAAQIAALVAAETARGAARRPDALRELLRRSAVDMGAPGKDDVYGWGFIGEAPSCES